ncbi:hypothetical protein [Pseudomarimonas salicorniae]|uniref:DUF3352 domain-containing protein n=1 Tax=Pseudomarimonas salicorniae TaxID=2933270 RepID=A0ABT0GKH4_9GAMM|nr:hypothetical protein [Lysobacter sp. CAU 1642]MCK7595036.1 hypothetical protein [Lysobacter sp. CAU 1642]
MNKLLWALALVALAVVGWLLFNRSQDAALSGLTSVSPAASEMLEFIPADTPYALAALQPVPDEVADAMWAQAESSMAMWPQMAGELREKLAESADPGDASMLKLLDALEAEFKGKTLRESAGHIGLPSAGFGAIYGIGPLPVMRVRLADPAKLEALIGRIQASAGLDLAQKQLGEARYWTLPDSPEAPPALPLLAVIGDQMVLTVHPLAGGEALLRQLLGLDKPALSQAAEGELVRRAGELGFLPYAVGYVDNLQLLRQLTDADQSPNAALWQAMQKPVPQLDETCRLEFEGLARTLPGASFGISRLDATGNAMRSVFHLSPEISTELLKLRAPMPGGDPSGDEAIASFGLALSLQALPGVVSRLAARVTDAPYACADLQSLNSMAAEAGKQINNPAVFAAAPMVYGLMASLDRFEIASGDAAPAVEGTLVLGSDNPASLIGMAKGFVPQLAQLEVPADGTPVKLPEIPGSPPGTPELMVAQSERLLGFATAPMADRLKDRLVLDPDYQPLLAAQVRPRLYELIADAMEQAMAAMPEGREKEQMQLQVRLMRESYAKGFSQSTFTLEFTERGVEMVQTMETR